MFIMMSLRTTLRDNTTEVRKREEKNVATSVRKQRIVPVLDASRNVTRYVVPNVRFLKDMTTAVR